MPFRVRFQFFATHSIFFDAVFGLILEEVGQMFLNFRVGPDEVFQLVGIIEMGSCVIPVIHIVSHIPLIFNAFFFQ